MDLRDQDDVPAHLQQYNSGVKPETSVGREERGAQATGADRCRSAQDRRAISGPLAGVTRGHLRSLGTGPAARSGPLAAVAGALPKLIMRVRFPSPAPM